LQEETYYQYKQQAEELALRIEDNLERVLAPEELRPYNEYQFFTVEDAPLLNTKEIAFSPLSQLPQQSTIPGILGYFELTPDNILRTPYLPSLNAQQLDRSSLLAKLSPEAIEERTALRAKIESAIRSVKTESSAPSELTAQNSEAKTASPINDVEVIAGANYDVTKEESESISSVASAARAPAPPVLVGSRAFAKKTKKSDYPSKLSKQLNTQSISSLKLNTKYWTEDNDSNLSQRSLNLANREKRSSRIESVAVPSRKGTVDKLQIAGKAKSMPSSESSIKTRQQNRTANFGQTQQSEVDEGASADLGADIELANSLKFPKEKSKALLETSKTYREMFKDDGLNPSTQKSVKEGLSSQRQLARSSTVSKAERRAASAKLRTNDSPIGIETFVASIDPIQSIRLNEKYILFFRRVWKKDGRFLQGFIAENETFFSRVVRDEFAKSSLSEIATLVLGYEGEVLTAFRPAVVESSFSSSFRRGSNQIRESNRVEPSAERVLLSRRNLPPPLETFELLFTVETLPTSSGVFVIHAFAASFVIVLLLGTYFIYRLGIGHIELAEQRSNFVSAVSHELKTPLTSIRMYGEMLREGWVQDPEKQRSYYDFIFHESERLSRLISNVLRLSSLDSNNEVMTLKHCPPSQLLSLIESKIQSMTEAAHFSVSLESIDTAGAILVDEDGFVQIFVNLVDNAIKFSSGCEKQQIVLSFHKEEKNSKSYGVFTIRDFGPGIEKAQLRNIFELFYRGENEMTRSTPGTGIGLALVQELSRKMDGFVSVTNENPGSAFHIHLPFADS
jgi:signal transduction histidine kinase